MKISREAFMFSLLRLGTPVVTRAFVASTPLSRRAFAAITSTSMVSSSATEVASGAATALAENPFLEQDDLPKFSKIEPEYLTPAVETLLEKLEQDFAKLESDLSQKDSPDYEEVLPEVERMQFPLGYTWGVAGHLNGVKNGDELRQAYETNQPKVVQAMTKFSQSKPLYDALSAIEKQWGETKSSEDDFEMQQKRRAVENSLLGMKLGGVGLEGAEKERFNEIKMRLAALATTFSNNVLDTTKDFSLTIEDPAKMEGVPDSAKGLWANAHIQFLKSQAKEGDEDVPEMDAEKGPWRITLDMPSYIPAMSHLKDRELREQVYKAYLQRSSEIHGDKNNVPLIYEILTLRKEMAKLVGFNNYAELSLAKKMAPSVESVEELTDLIAEKAVPAAKKELEEITALAKEQGGEEYANIDKLEPWDVTFWSERLKESKFDMTEEELRPYFALPAVLDGMFGLLNRIFDVTVKSADGEVEVWNKDVRFFKIFDNESGKHIASFFLDPYSRPADKRGGAWMDVCIGKSQAVNRDIPVAYLTCNGSPPVGDQPSLMTFREVETLFHETGHGLQHMLTKASVGDVAGINGIEWDAVELPSQFMENWCYDRPTVYGFAKHWKTGEPLPEEKFQKLCDQKIFNAGMMSCRQLYFGQLDMTLHADYDPIAGEKGEGKTIFDVQREVASKYVPHAMPLEEDRFLCSFSHIFAGGYSAGYYSYKWAEVMSADAFGAFEDVGLDNEEEVKKVGKKFKDTVLSLGGGVPPSEVFKMFRGRDPTPDALLRHNGLA
ncbi:oligopeptidase A [Nitzschia inconspicua]|uniref:oligopeptidase A n=1 Tax=Nitzschia inconspicua TaxID=303405 RepID=A0A9K3KEW6_9STRA|nr:oligopeptidase A [Nitzschia inconspicua]